MKSSIKLFTYFFIISTLPCNLQASNSPEQISPAKIKKSVSFSDATTVIEITRSSNSLNLNSIINRSTSAGDLNANLRRKTEELLAKLASNKAARNK